MHGYNHDVYGSRVKTLWKGQYCHKVKNILNIRKSSSLFLYIFEKN